MTYFPNYNIHNPPMLSSLSSASTQNSPLDEPNLQNTKQESSDEMKPIEDFLAAEFSQLSAEEKTKALSDMYCVEDLNENPGMAQQSLVDFEIRLQNGMFPIYEAAWNQNRAYVEDPLFRLKFLRANMYDVSKSVNQLVNFLGHKATYFGLDKLARDITLHDLNQEDMDLMLSGFYHIQDGEDQSGRVVVYMLNHLLGKCKAETLIRVNYYIWFNILLPLPAVQKKGIVAVYWDLTKPGENIALPGLHWMVSVLDYMQSVPVRFSASHICAKTGIGSGMLNNYVVGFTLKAMPQYVRVRSLLHQGSDVELQYHLQRHGLPDTFPVDSNGNVRRGILNVWFHLHMANEASCTDTINRCVVMEEGWTTTAVTDESEEGEEEEVASSANGYIPEQTWGCMGSSLVSGLSAGSSARSSEDGTSSQSNAHRILPDHTEKDVLLGRGRDIQNHIGNIHFREFLTAHQDDYDEAPRNQRRQIATSLYNVLKSDGIRFWHKSSAGEWEEIGALEGEKKIGQLFRTRRKRK